MAIKQYLPLVLRRRYVYWKMFWDVSLFPFQSVMFLCFVVCLHKVEWAAMSLLLRVFILRVFMPALIVRVRFVCVCLSVCMYACVRVSACVLINATRVWMDMLPLVIIWLVDLQNHGGQTTTSVKILIYICAEWSTSNVTASDVASSVSDRSQRIFHLLSRC